MSLEFTEIDVASDGGNAKAILAWCAQCKAKFDEHKDDAWPMPPPNVFHIFQLEGTGHFHLQCLYCSTSYCPFGNCP